MRDVIEGIELFDAPNEDEIPDPLDVKLGLAIGKNTRCGGSARCISSGPGQRDRDLQRIAEIERRREAEAALRQRVAEIKRERADAI